MDCVVTPLKTLMGFSVHLNVQLKFYNLPFYNILGKFSAILGPLIVGVVTQWTNESTVGVASLSVLFLFGLIIFWLLPSTD